MVSNHSQNNSEIFCTGLCWIEIDSAYHILTLSNPPPPPDICGRFLRKAAYEGEFWQRIRQRRRWHIALLPVPQHAVGWRRRHTRIVTVTRFAVTALLLIHVTMEEIVVVSTAAFVGRVGFVGRVVVIIAIIISVIVIGIWFVDFLVDVLDVSLPLKVSPPGVMAERKGDPKLWPD